MKVQSGLRESSSFEFVERLDSVMAEQFRESSSTESGSSPGSSGGDQNGCVMHLGPGGNASETSMWEEWTQATSAVGDEVSTSNFLPDLTTCSASSRLSFQQSDMLSTWMSTFHPLSHPSLISPDDHFEGLAHLGSGKVLHPEEMVEDATDALPLVYESKTTGVSRQLLRALSPLSPSSPLAIHNGLLNPLGDPWDGCASSSLQWSGTTYQSDRSSFFPDHSATAIDHLEGIPTTAKPRHTDIFIGPNGTFESATPGGWTPQLLFDHPHHGSEMKVGPTAVPPMKLMASLREAGDVYAESKLNVPQETGLVNLRDGDRSTARGAESSTMTTPVIWPGKHRLELVELEEGDADVTGIPALLKRPKITPVEDAKALQWSDQTLRGAELRAYCGPGSSSLASQAVDIMAIGPALNTNGKPRARRGSATDPQSVYARHRREKINERLKSLQNLVPNGAKVDIVTMLDEAIHYVKFLQNQVELLKSDDFWMYATPNNYNGMDLSELGTHSQELESSA